MSEVIYNLGLGSLALALIGYGMSSMGPTYLDYQIAKGCYSVAALIIIILVGYWLISKNMSITTRILMAIIVYGAIGAGWATLIGIANKKEEYQVKNAAIKAYVGKLQQEKKILFSGKDHIYPIIEFGDSGSGLIWDGPAGTPMFKIADDNEIKIEIVDGQVMVSTKILGGNGTMIAEIINNEWKVNPRNSWDRNYTKNALEVRDPNGDIIIQIRLVGDRVQMQGKLYGKNGRGIMFFSTKTGGAMKIIDYASPELDPKIKPLFKYPSELHLGEFVK